MPRKAKHKKLSVATKAAIKYFFSGCAEGAAAGVVVGVCTGGIGFITIPIFAIIRGLQKVARIYFFHKNPFKNRLYALKRNNQDALNLGLELFSGFALGAGIGATVGVFLAPFTFGLSIPACALIGGAIGFAEACFTRWRNSEFFSSANVGLLAGEFKAYNHARIGALTGAGIGIALAPFTFGISVVVGAVAGAFLGCILGYVLSRKFSKSTPYSLNTVSSSNQGTSIGISIGAMAGFGIGLALAPFTGGASIIICTLLGAAIGGLIGQYSGPAVAARLPSCTGGLQESENSSMSSNESYKKIRRQLGSGFIEPTQSQTDQPQSPVAPRVDLQQNYRRKTFKLFGCCGNDDNFDEDLQPQNHRPRTFSATPSSQIDGGD